jgi:hypothetical protein
MRAARVSRKRRVIVIVILGMALLLAGCGGASDSDQVRAKVRQFAVAAAAHNYRTICQDVLAPSLLADLKNGGIACVQAMRISFAHVTSPRLVIGNVAVSGSSATVLTISQATGEKTLLTSLHLVRTGSGWRISALGAPVLPGH